MARTRIVIDTDPGQDDAVAILLALASPEEIEIAGIVAVAGSQSPLPSAVIARGAGAPDLRPGDLAAIGV